ncbi:hypothetical protein [Crassaminicella profunda]|uniref:hypothetical protein n=1 Tax=Crassaminicella profunda TaxID=1286698 RepID=UPI001CA61D9C|nr:hypothetical protein [Crassaminicella profunda]QZY55821.1 hypothetical protein K7H06_02040 [Crassaminicella profunda]
MKKIMTGILLGTVVLTATVTSFAAGNENIGVKAKTLIEAKPIIQAKMGGLDIKSLGKNDIIEINDENGIIKINGMDIKKIDGDMIKIDEAALKELGLDNVDVAIADKLELPNFEEFMKEMKEGLKDINKTDLKSLEKSYNEAVDLEKAKKFDEASKKWEAFDKILGKYFKEGEMISGYAIELTEDAMKKIDTDAIELKVAEAN